MHQMQWQERHKDAQILISQISTKLQNLLGIREEEQRKFHKELQDLDLEDSTHK
jgi:hypothetical protein